MENDKIRLCGGFRDIAFRIFEVPDIQDETGSEDRQNLTSETLADLNLSELFGAPANAN